MSAGKRCVYQLTETIGVDEHGIVRRNGRGLYRWVWADGASNTDDTLFEKYRRIVDWRKGRGG